MKYWHSNDFVSDQCYKKLVCNTGTIPKFYALPKIHKEGIPYRPIISAINSPCYNLSKYYHDVLSNITGKKDSHIKNSYEFVEKIKKEKIPQGFEMISLDVKSLFTNIPLDLVISTISDKWHLICEHTNIPKNQFLQKLMLIFEYNVFKFNDQVYKQKYGTPMGAPLSPVLADLIMELVEENCFQKINFPVQFFYRYVDDILTCVPIDKISKMLEIFNSFHNKLQFTIENEKPVRTISFLDVELSIQDNIISTNWYKKPTWSERILNFLSHHSISQKIAMVYNMTDKAIILSDKKFHFKNLNIVRNTLRNNHYPNNFINKYIQFRINNINNPNNKEKNKINDSESIIVLPFVRQIYKQFNMTMKKYNLKPVYKNDNKLDKNFDKLKDRDPIAKKSNLVYKIPCNDCDGVYIGQTKRYLQKRIYEHTVDIKKPPNQQTALTKHAIDNNHTFNFDNVRVACNESNYKKRLTKEMVHILKDKNAVNDRTDTQNLSIIYNGLFDK